MSGISVSYEEPVIGTTTGFIVINDTSSSNKTIRIPTSGFFVTPNDNKTSIHLNNNDDTFTQFQKKMRYLDCVKDATKPGPDVSAHVEVIYAGTYNKTNTKFQILKQWEDTFDIFMENEKYIKNYAWTKKTDDSTLDPMLDERYIFKESGLSPDYFIKPPIRYVGNIANEIIDPAGRSRIDTTIGDITFPVNGVTLELTRSFLGFFGFDNCSLTTRRQGSKNYEYEITIGYMGRNGGRKSLKKRTRRIRYKIGGANKRKFIGTGTQSKRHRTSQPTHSKDIIITSRDQNGDWFAGNSVKNNRINTNNPGLTTEQKRALFLTKEMGDVLQVLIMFIWSKLNTGDSYSITTCDKVVCLLCMVLQVNCILTYAEKGETKGGVEAKRMRAISVFEPLSGKNPEERIIKLKKQFESTRKSILSDNQSFIDCLKKLKGEPTDPDVNVHVSGLSAPIIIPKYIYQKFIKELQQINDILYGLKIDVLGRKMTQVTYIDDNDKINKFIQLIKINFTFIEFIRITKDKKVKITMTSIYTSNSNLWIDTVNPNIVDDNNPSFLLYKYKTHSFYNLITNTGIHDQISNEPSIVDLVHADSIDIQKVIFENGRSNGSGVITGGVDPLYDTLLPKINHLNYPSMAKYHEENYDENNNPNIKYKKYKDYNLYDTLVNDVNDILDRLHKKDYFDETYTMLLHYFYLRNEVYYQDTGLGDIIESLFMNPRILKDTEYGTPAENAMVVDSRAPRTPDKEPRATNYPGLEPMNKAIVSIHQDNHQPRKTAWGGGSR